MEESAAKVNILGKPLSPNSNLNVCKLLLLNPGSHIIPDLCLWRIWYLFNTRLDSGFQFRLWEIYIQSDFLTLKYIVSYVQNISEAQVSGSGESLSGLLLVEKRMFVPSFHLDVSLLKNNC